MQQSEQKPVALVTGGAQGIGIGITQHLLTQGWRVASENCSTARGSFAQTRPQNL